MATFIRVTATRSGTSADLTVSESYDEVLQKLSEKAQGGFAELSVIRTMAGETQTLAVNPAHVISFSAAD